MLVVCRGCGDSRAAEGPGIAGTCACGAALPKLPAASDHGLALVARPSLVGEGRGATVSLALPRQTALVGIVFGAAWASVSIMLAVLVWMASGLGGGLFLVALVSVAGGLVLAGRGALALDGALSVTVSSTEVRVGTSRFGSRVIPAAEVVGFTVHRNPIARYQVFVLRRDGRADPVPYAFERLANAVWLAEHLDALFEEHRPSSAYRGLVAGS